LELTCQRCNETLRETDRYCPVCGLPQLMYSASETPPLPLGEELFNESDTTGAISGIAGVNGIVWRPALQAALILAVPAGLLCSGLSPTGLLALVWMTGAAVWAVSLYSKRTQPGRVSTGSGARIGLVTGLLASWLTLGVNGFSLWAERFLMHQGGQMDSDWQNSVDKSVETYQQMFVQMGMASAQVSQSLASQRVWMLSPEGRAGSALLALLTGSAFLVLLSTIGGAIGARVLTQPRRPKIS
jgi:hypothetical protein